MGENVMSTLVIGPDLLKRYMAHVLMQEGTTYTDFYEWEGFTKDERTYLDKLGDEVWAESKAAVLSRTARS
jgi:hypothetical protein